MENKCEVQILPNKKNPLIIAKYQVDPGLPTAIIYGMYDITHSEIQKDQKTDPFSLLMGKENIIGRGVASGKGQTLMGMLTLFELIHEKKLTYNIIYLVEGEGTTWSLGLKTFLEQEKKSLWAETFIVPYGTHINDIPSISVQQRGQIHLQLDLVTAQSELDQNLAAGLVANPIQEANKLLSKLYGLWGNITIPYFYYDAEDIQAEVKIMNKKIKTEKEELRKKYGATQTEKNKEYDMITQTGLKPHIEITAFHSGQWYTIPSKTRIIFDIYIVPHQKTENTINAFSQRIKTNIPKYLTYNITVEYAYEPAKIQIEDNYITQIEAVHKKSWRKGPIRLCNSVGLPVISYATKILWQKNIIAISCANSNSNPHGTNENLDIETLKKSSQRIKEFLSN